ncbi:group-specific protein [Virgibacillus chiguensis]|uniref:Nucleoside 2-deoxyribosyltransferase n=1 Tax=Virgibacillus chiguensis TaxID=411959 RepID=A0A1M5XKS7_9BACI|nr:hypothetical protein SAMN05421807_12917 [Virgibacillus chiguensis]
MNFYIASSFKNIESVRYIRGLFIKDGHVLTYDWTKNDRASTIEALKCIGQKQKDAVIAADVIIVLLPAGKGSHIEMGIALGRRKKSFFIHQIKKSIILLQQAHSIIYLK